MKHFFEKFKPSIYESLIKELVDIYKEEYRKHNKNKKPSKKNVNNYIQMVLSNGHLESKYNSLLNETIDELYNLIKKHTIRARFQLIFDYTLLFAVESVIIAYIFVTIGINRQSLKLVNQLKRDSFIKIFINSPFLIIAITAFFLYLVLFVIHLKRK